MFFTQNYWNSSSRGKYQMLDSYYGKLILKNFLIALIYSPTAVIQHLQDKTIPETESRKIWTWVLDFLLYRYIVHKCIISHSSLRTSAVSAQSRQTMSSLKTKRFFYQAAIQRQGFKLPCSVILSVYGGDTIAINLSLSALIS